MKAETASSSYRPNRPDQNILHDLPHTFVLVL